MKFKSFLLSVPLLVIAVFLGLVGVTSAFVGPTANPPGGGGAITVGSGVPASSVIITDVGGVGKITTGIWAATDIAIADGGTSASTAATARTNLGAAASGANSDITSLAPPASTDFTLSQNSVAVFTSLWTGALANTLYLKTGNVGINTTNPLQKLDVSGTAKFSTAELGPTGSYIGYNTYWNGSNWIYRNTDFGAVLRLNPGDGRFQFFMVPSGTAGTTASTPERLTILTGGNVGIGTTAPQGILNVKGATGYGTIRVNPSTAGAESGIALFDDTTATDTNDAWVISQNGWGNTGDFIIGNENNGAGGNVRLLIEKAGNVGIGTTTPGAYKLNVNGATNITGALTVTGGCIGCTGDNVDNLLFNGDFEAGLAGWTNFDATSTTAYSGNLAGQANGASDVLSDEYIPVNPVTDILQLEGYFRKSVAGGTPGVFYFGYIAYTAAKTPINTSPCGTYCYFAASNYSLPADGNWHKFSATTTGEGTSYPNFPVGTKYVRVLALTNYSASSDAVTLVDHITLKRINHGPLFVGNNFNGTNLVNQQQQTQLHTTSTNNFIITPPSTGKVGIRATSPEGELHIQASALASPAAPSTAGDDLVLETTTNTGLTIRSGATSAGAIYFGDIASSSSGRIIYNHSTDALSFTTSGNVDTLNIKGGNVGIGTTTPQAQLDITGSLRVGSKTDDVNKLDSGIIAEQYDSGTETEGWRVIHARSDSTTNSVRIGGSTAAQNAATEIGFYTAPNVTTASGTERVRIDSAGNTIFNGGITLGGVNRTTWPGGLDVPIFKMDIYGATGDLPFRTTATTATSMRLVYGPFVYGMPACPAGYTRNFRLYGEYVDNISSGGQVPTVRMDFTTGTDYDFTLSNTNGGAPSYRTYLSSLFTSSNTDHATIKAWVSGTAGPYVEVRKLELWQYCI